MRILFRLGHPDVPPWEYPLGMMGSSVRKSISFSTDEAVNMQDRVLNFINGSRELLDQFHAAFPEQESPSELDVFWQEQLETLTKWQQKHAGKIILETQVPSVNADTAVENSPWTNAFLFP